MVGIAFIARLPLASATPGVGSLPEASMVRRFAPGPLMVRESVILSSPCVSKIVAGPLDSPRVVLAVATLLVMILCFMPVPLWQSATSH